MGKEIERKFLVRGDAWRTEDAILYRQGYLSTEKRRTVRVRVGGDSGFLTIKGPTEGASRAEFEYDIPVEDAQYMLDTLCERPLIEKQRHLVDYAGQTWEIDEFQRENEGLVVAEVELQSEDQTFDKPSWLAEEVTGDPRYYNASLVRHPFRQWQSDKPSWESPANYTG